MVETLSRPALSLIKFDGLPLAGPTQGALADVYIFILSIVLGAAV
jgi:hypothetical protein